MGDTRVMPALPAVRRAGVVVILMCAASGCASSPEESVGAPERVASTEVAAATPVPAPSATAAPAPTSTTVPSPSPSPSSEADCRRVEEFGPGAADRWIIVDDGVMGGRSQGNATIADDAMRFSGLIETEGGGFSSVRALVPADALAGATELRFRARSDGRTYELIADDGVAGRDGRVSHFGRIPLTGADAWEEVSVSLTDLEARIFGTPVDDVAFDPAQAASIGVILADGTDGPFELTIDRIDACR
ncbi:CIA30 family protein [Nodularia spumigena]|uniref:CIA30 family protein n=1 Tax=Nodularia spumigena TaxID=70799 RepID=UPI002B1ECDAA|nr:CIA30 family protein [Nodularia spumigena]MEA5558051.1 CIA30 family protein [Nodularia spumigena CH309]